MKSNYNYDHKIEEVKEEPILEEVKAEPDPEPIPVEATPVKDGEIANCIKVNVRTAPVIGDNILCVLDQGRPIKIDLSYESSEWFKIVTEAGLEGYIKKEFVKEV